MSLIYEERTELLRRCFFDVQNEVGLGRQEEAYHQACKLWLEEHEIPHASKPPLRLMLDGEEAYAFLFETNQFAINRGLSYLPALGLEWGIAADFGKRAAQFTGLHRSTP